MMGNLREIRSWSFILGVIVAIVIGILSVSRPSVLLSSLLIVLGIIVGILNVNARETKDFLLAAVALVIVSSFGGSVVGEVTTIGPYLESVLNAFLSYIIPTTIIVAIKSIFVLARD